MSGVRQELIPLAARDDWRAALAEIPHSFAHTWESCEAMWLTTGWPTFLYHLDTGTARVVCPVSERELRGHTDVVTPYGFGGFAATAQAPQLLEHWRSIAQAQGWICGYVGLNPLFAPPALRRAGEYVEYNDVYVLRLDRGEAELQAGLSENRRRQLRTFEAGPARLIMDRERLGAFFLANAAEFFARKGAGGAYAFSEATLARILALENTLLLGAETGGRIEAVCILAFTPHAADYLFGISLPEGRTHSATLLWRGAMLLRERGIPRLNLGGGVRRGDGVAGFKERFGAERLPLGCLKQVYRPDLYADLCREAGADPTDRNGYFPAYRGPAATRRDVPAAAG